MIKVNSLQCYSILDGSSETNLCYIEIDKQGCGINGIKFFMFFHDQKSAEDFLSLNRKNMKDPDKASVVRIKLDTDQTPENGVEYLYCYAGLKGFVLVNPDHPFGPGFESRGAAWRVLTSKLFSLNKDTLEIVKVKVRRGWDV